MASRSFNSDIDSDDEGHQSPLGETFKFSNAIQGRRKHSAVFLCLEDGRSPALKFDAPGKEGRLDTRVQLNRGNTTGRSQVSLVLPMPIGSNNSLKARAVFEDGYGDLQMKWKKSTIRDTEVIDVSFRFSTLEADLPPNSAVTKYYNEHRLLRALETIKARSQEDPTHKNILRIVFVTGNTNEPQLFFENFYIPPQFHPHGTAPTAFFHVKHYRDTYRKSAQLEYEEETKALTILNRFGLQASFQMLHKDFYRVTFRLGKHINPNTSGVMRLLGIDNPSCPKIRVGFRVRFKWQLSDTERSSVTGVVTEQDLILIESNQEVLMSVSAGIPKDEYPGKNQAILYKLEIEGDDTAYTRILKALIRIRDYCRIPPQAGDPKTKLCKCLIFGERPTKLVVHPQVISTWNEGLAIGLNQEQRAAAIQALEYNMTIIHGPSGTGKSQVLVRIVNAWFGNWLKKGKARESYPGSVIMVAHSNLAVERILQHIKAFIRDPANRKTNALKHMAIVRYHSNIPIDNKHAYINDTAPESSDSHVEFDKDYAIHTLRCQEDPSYESQHLSFISKQMTDQEGTIFRQTRTSIDAAILQKSNVILCTSTTAGCLAVEKYASPKLLLFDEAGQVHEPNFLIPFALPSVTQVVLAGDPNQLPPVSQGDLPILRQSPLERCLKAHGNDGAGGRSAYLKINHRNPTEIVEISSKIWYQGSMISTGNERQFRAYNFLCQKAFGFVSSSVWVDSKWQEEEDAKGYKFNRGNAQIIRRLIDRFHSIHQNDQVDMPTIAIISMYSSQLETLRNALDGISINLSVNAVDAYQGSEAELVIVDLVRSNSRKDIGYLRETRRFNCAITRAKQGLIVVGNYRHFTTLNTPDSVVNKLEMFARMNSTHIVTWDERFLHMKTKVTECPFNEKENHRCQ